MKKPSSHLSIGKPQKPKVSPHTRHAHRAMEIVSIPKNALNITYNSDSPAGKMLSNLAPSPFFLDDRKYESVEGFWQGLKFEDEAQRAIIARLSGL